MWSWFWDTKTMNWKKKFLSDTIYQHSDSSSLKSWSGTLMVVGFLSLCRCGGLLSALKSPLFWCSSHWGEGTYLFVRPDTVKPLEAKQGTGFWYQTSTQIAFYEIYWRHLKKNAISWVSICAIPCGWFEQVYAGDVVRGSALKDETSAKSISACD